MNTSKITNIHIDGLNEAGNHFSLGCDYDGARYHIWVNENFQIDWAEVAGAKATLYKNPPRGIKYKSPGHFDTRHLSTTSKFAQELILYIINWALSTDMLKTALAEQAEAKQDREAEYKRLADIARINEAGPELLAACRLAEANLAPLYSSEHLVLKGLRAAIKKAEG